VTIQGRVNHYYVGLLLGILLKGVEGEECFNPLHNFTSFPTVWRAAFIKSINLYRQSESINSWTTNVMPCYPHGGHTPRRMCEAVLNVRRDSIDDAGSTPFCVNFKRFIILAHNEFQVNIKGD
jgi:hypothetical protein